MEYFFIDEDLFADIGDLMDDLGFEEDCSNVPDDWSIECFDAYLEPIERLSADWILERIDGKRFSEDSDEQADILKALSLIDFDAVNAKMPKLYYPTKVKFTITKSDLLEWCGVTSKKETK